MTESIISLYLLNFQIGESPNMLFELCPTGMKISRCVFAGVGPILLFSVLLMGFVNAAFCRHTCLICRRPQCDLKCLPGRMLCWKCYN